jgi:hypothetical protein
VRRGSADLPASSGRCPATEGDARGRAGKPRSARLGRPGRRAHAAEWHAEGLHVKGASCEEINGVGWYVPTDQFADLSELDLTVYTIGRTPVVEVVPSELPPRRGVRRRCAGDARDPIKQAIPKARALRLRGVSADQRRSCGSAPAGSAGRRARGSRGRTPPTSAGTSTSRREAGHRVELVDHQRAVGKTKKSTRARPSQPTASNAWRRAPHLAPAGRRRPWPGSRSRCAPREVLRLEVVELVVATDADLGGERRLGPCRPAPGARRTRSRGRRRRSPRRARAGRAPSPPRSRRRARRRRAPWRCRCSSHRGPASRRAGSPAPPSAIAAASGVAAHSRAVTTIDGITGRPGAASATFMKPLSMLTAEASTPAPT